MKLIPRGTSAPYQISHTRVSNHKGLAGLLQNPHPSKAHGHRLQKTAPARRQAGVGEVLQKRVYRPIFFGGDVKKFADHIIIWL